MLPGISAKTGNFFHGSLKVHYVVGLSRDQALDWAEATFASLDSAAFIYDQFEEKLKGVFDHPNYVGTASSCLVNLRQGTVYWQQTRSGMMQLSKVYFSVV